MKITDLPASVLEELCQSEYWRIDIDPGFDAKHEFFIRWEYLLPMNFMADNVIRRARGCNEVPYKVIVAVSVAQYKIQGFASNSISVGT